MQNTKMLLTNDDHYDYVDARISESPELVFISTFGLYAGITFDGRDTTEWGENYSLRTRNVLDSMTNVDQVKILIGVSEYTSCAGKNTCIDCEKQYVKSLIRLLNHKDLYERYEWKISHNLHLKSSLFFYDLDCDPTLAKGIAGGRNFTNSNWADITFVLDSSQIDELYTYSQDLWESSHWLDDNRINTIFEEQGISEKALRAIGGV